MSNNDFMLNIIAVLNKRLSKAQLKSDLKGIDNTLSVKVIAKLATALSKKQLGDSLKQLNNLYVQVGTKFKTDKDTRNKLLNEIEQLQKNLTELQLKVNVEKGASQNAVGSVISAAKTAQKYADKTSITLDVEVRKEKAVNDILYIGQKYSKLFSNLSASQKYENLLNSAYSISDKSQLQEVRAQISAFTSELKAHGLAAESTSAKWRKLIDRAKELFSAASIIRTVFSQAKQAVSTTIALDKVYTDLVKVNDELNRNDYADYLSRCNQKAQELATTQKALIEGATEFSKSGYNLSTSDALTEKSTILSNVGDMSASDSAKAIISGVQAYDAVDGYTDVVDKAQALIDKYNEIGNTASITTAEIAQGVQKVGSVFADSNTSVDEFIALLSAGNRQFQDADSLSLGLRTAALRIRGCTAELEMMNEETEGVYTSASKLAEKIEGLTNVNGTGGVKILEADGETFRSIYDIFLDISKVYKDMSDTDASALLELIAGKNRASAISATLNNMSEAEEILQNSLNAAGSAQKEYDAYLESTEAHLQQFQSKLVETYTTFVNGDMISHTADLGTAVLDLVNKTDLLKHSLIAIATLKVGQGISAVGGAVAGTVTQMNTLGNAIQQVKSLPLEDTLKTKPLIEIGEATQNLTEKNLRLLLSQEKLTMQDKVLILQQHNLTQEEAKSKLEKMGLTTATNANTAANTANATSANTLKGAFTGLTASVKATWAAMSALQKASIIFAAISTAWSIGSSIINGIKQSNEELVQSTQEAADKINSINDSLKSNTETVENAKKRYAEFAQEVENLGKITQSQGTLSNEEYEEFLDLSNQLAVIFPSLTKNYDVNGNAILDLSGDVNTIVGSLDSLIQKEKELANQKIMEEFPDVFKGWNQDLSDAEQKVKSAKTEFDKINQAYSSLEKGQSIQMGFDVNGSNIDTYGKLTTIGQYEGWLKDLGLTYEETVVAGGRVVTAIGDIDTAFTSKLETAREDLQYAQQQLEGQSSSINQYLNTWLQGEFSYIQIEDSGLQTAIQDMLFNFDWDNIPENKRGDWNYVSEYLRRNILFEINKVQDDPVISKAISEVFTNTELTPNEKSNYLQQIRDFFGEDSTVVISLKPQIEETETLQKQCEKAIEDTKKKFDGYDPTAFFKEHSINTQEEIDRWQKIAQGARDAAEAEEEYLSQGINGDYIKTFDQAWADSFTSENEKVRELGDTLLGLVGKGRLTKEIFEGADSTAGDYFKNLGISADEAILKINKLVDESSQLSSMASQISSISNALGTKQEDGFVSADTLSGFDVEVHGLESWDRFQEVLGSTASSYEECQEAANALATEWINSSNFLAQLTEENKEYYETQLQAMGVENYEEVLFYAQALNEAKEVLSQSSLMLGDATQDEIEALIAEGQYSELTANMILALYDAKIAEQAATIDTSADCEDLIALAGDTDRTSRSIELLIQLMDIYSGLESGAYDGNRLLREEALAEVDRIKKELEALANGETQELPIEPTVKLGAKGRASAKAAGKSAGDAYKDGLKEALSDIEGVISGVTKALDRQISSINTEKSAALDAIDEQKEAIENAKESALEAIETERNARLDAIEEQISSKQKTIDGINDEIKLMRDANSEREKQLALERAKFELERQQNQKTKLIYSSDKGLHYETDTTGIANAREQVRQIEFEIEITNKEKEIDLLEKEIDLLNEQKDQINEYYDDLIKKTEAFYDSQLKNLEKQRKETEIYYESLTKSIEDQKAKYQELTELLEKAELSAKLKQLGIDEEALLNGSAEEFEKLKAAYLDIVYQLNAGNDEVLLKLQELSGYEGTAPTMLEDSNGKLITMNEKLGTASQEVGNINSSLGETASTTSNVASNVDTLKTNLTDVNTLVTDEQTTFSTLLQTVNDIIEAINQKTAAIQEEQNAVGIATSREMADFLLLKEKILEVKETLDTINGTVDTLDATPIDNLTESFQSLYEKILLVSTTLGAGIEGQGEGVTNSITSAIQALNEISFEEGIITQFDNLRTAIDSVSSAISGGGESSGGEGQSSNSGSGKGGESGGKGSNGEDGGNSLTGAIESMGETANKVIGEPEAEGDGTVIGEFGSMKTAVNDIRDAIGTEGGKDGNSGGEDDDTLISSMEYLGDKTEEEMGGSGGDGIIARFEEFRDVIGEADEHVKGISDGLDEIDGETVECTIKVNIETSGGIPAYASGTALGAMNLDSAEYNAKYQGNAHVSGTANVTGNWGVRKPGKSLVGEIGQEIWVHAKNGTFETVGDNGPEWIKTEKDDLIFNHLQTKELLSKGNIVKTGKAYANGTVQYSDGTTIMPDGSTLRPLQPGDKGWDLLQKFQPLVDKILSGEEKIVSNAMFEGQRQFERWTNEITNNTAINNVTNNRNVQPVVNHINVTCPGVTSQQVAEQLGNVIGQELNKQFNGFSLYADQMSRKR